MIMATVDVLNKAGAKQDLIDLIRADFATAFEVWSPALAANVNFNVRFEILDQTTSGRLQGRPALMVPVGTIDGMRVLEGAASYELRTGIDLGTEHDIVIQADIDYLLNSVYFGNNSVPDRVSAVSAFLHELGHGIGFVGWRDHTTGILPGAYQTPFDMHILMKDGFPYFEGVNAAKVYGGPVPLTYGNMFHLGNPAPKPGADLVDDLMNGVIFKAATAYPISDLVLAILADLGIGTRNSDSLTAPQSGQTLKAGAGFDSVSFNTESSGYTFSYDAGELSVSNLSASYNADIIDAERIVFTDKTLALDLDGSAGQSYRIYVAAFGRAPDTAGLTFWTGAMDGGISLKDLAHSFISSPEFNGRYGENSTSRDYIRLIYENVLDRQPDESGYLFWTGAMDDGLTREDLLISFSESPENKANTIGTISNGIWLDSHLA